LGTILIIGSGASGVHFALSVLKKGYEVTMLDVGWEKPDAVHPDDHFNDLKSRLKDPTRYFLGKRYEAVVYPGSQDDYYTRYYGFPPSKSHVFSPPQTFKYEAKGIEPLISFAQGGLAEAWTGGAYPLNDHELREYPFRYAEIEPHYNEVARRIGMMGANDDLARFFPYHDNLLEPLNLDVHSKVLVSTYERKKARLNGKYRCYLGRSRVTTLSRDVDGRKGCSYCGRCLWGCPTESLYTPSITLKECRKYRNLNYVPGLYVSHFKYDADGQVTGVIAKSVHDQELHEFSADWIVLAAGTLSSSKIVMESILRETGEIVPLSGLMDNRQILIPFVNLNLLGKRYSADSYQYHQIAIGIERERPEEYVHGQITTLKSALVHPLIQNVPVDLRTATMIFRNLRTGLGIVNLNLYDRRRSSNGVTLKADASTGRPVLMIDYAPAEHEAALIKDVIKTVRGFLWGLGCVVPPGMIHVRPMGASVHYSGTLPMSAAPRPLTVSKDCRSHDFKNLYIVDGATMPFLPAKNITFTLMANAVRVAETAF
jgi:choline dehydrogenase-like flavoprotein